MHGKDADGDPLSQRRRVVNLVDNGLKYGERALRLSASSGQARLGIDADGAGVPDYLQRRVFEPIFRAESSSDWHTVAKSQARMASRDCLAAVRGTIITPTQNFLSARAD